MSEHEPKRQACDDRMGDMSCTLLKGHRGRHIDERVFGEVKPSYADLAARLADAEARAEAAEAAFDRVRKRHPRGDEEAGPLAPGLWCPTCGRERKDNGYGGCPDREALRGDQ